MCGWGMPISLPCVVINLLTCCLPIAQVAAGPLVPESPSGDPDSEEDQAGSSASSSSSHSGDNDTDSPPDGGWNWPFDF